MKKLRHVLITILILSSLAATAQTPRLYTPESGLINTQINNLYQDTDGFIWICTEGGLLKFDGMGFELFRHERDKSTSIISNTVNQIFEDSRGVKWVGTSNGLQIFNSDYNTFSTFDFGRDINGQRVEFVNNILEVPFEDSGSNLFISTGGTGVFVIDTKTHKLLTQKRKKISAYLNSKYIRSLFLDSERRLWVALASGGAVVLNADSLEPDRKVHWETDLQADFSHIRIEGFAEDPVTNNVIIASSSHGIIVFENATGLVRRARTKEAREAGTTAIILDNMAQAGTRKSFLLGDNDNDLSVFDSGTETLKKASITSIVKKIGRWKANQIFEDNQGNLWFGLYQTGVLVVPKSMFGFSNLTFSSNGIEGENSACILSVYDDHDNGTLWTGTDGAGLFMTKNGEKPVNFNKSNSALSSNTICTFAKDAHGTLWMGTYSDGLYCYNEGAGIRKYRNNSDIGSENIKILCYDKHRDKLYVGTSGAGLYIIDCKTQAVEKCIVSDDNKWVSALYLADNGLLWIGTYNGPMCYDPETGRIAKYDVTPGGASLRIYALSGDSDANIWLGTGEGIFRYAPSSGEIHQFTEKDGLANNVVKDIICIGKNEVWISTTDGLSRLSTKTSRFTNYHSYDGLQGDEFHSGAAFLSSSGKLYFGGNGGLSVFSPLMVDGGGHKVPQVYLSKLKILDKPVEYDPELGARNILDKHIFEAGRIRLPQNSNMFSIEFSVPEYTNPQRITYAYRMKGFDSGWKTTTAEYRIATYTNLPPGRYKFEIKAYFDGQEDEFSERDIDMIVLAPWYRQWWAYICYLIILICIGILVRGRYFETKKRQEEKKEAEIKELRLGLFTNLTHEIRTPLTLVMGPLKTLREGEENVTLKDTYNLMYRNCLRINRIVNQILDIRKADSGKLEMHFRETDVIYFIQDIMQSFNSLSDSRNIHLTLNSDRPEEVLWIDQGNFDKIIFNLLSNAFKHAPDGGTVCISVSGPEVNDGCLRSDVRNYVEISVFNSGSHIREEYIDKIFERFFQANPLDANSGSGLGLNLAKMLTELHHGKIEARNKADGVEFSLKIPAGKAHLSEEELKETELHKDLYVKKQGTSAETGDDVLYNKKENEERQEDTRSKRHLVIVEDDEETLSYMKSVLRRDYIVDACSNGNDAWPIISTTLPDAIISDLVMPGMDGIELCKRIKHNPSTNYLPVIILTGKDGDQERQDATDSGADKFLTKPISIELLKSSITQAISSREAIKGKFSAAMASDYAAVKMKSADDDLLKRINEGIRNNFDNPDYDVESLCQTVGISRVHLNRKLKESGNVPPSVLLKSYRLKQAAYLLVNNKVNISEVAYRVGFSSHSYFSSAFKDYFGLAPKEFVEKYMNDKDSLQFLK